MTIHRLIVRAALPLLAVAGAATAALADDAPPPQDRWFGKGQFGFLDSQGNSDAKSINGNLDIARIDGPWKNEIYVGALYGNSAGVASAERFEAHEQTNYNISKQVFVFGGLRYEHDLFDGFQYQASATGGAGYKFFDTPDTQLSVQAGAGYRRLRPEIVVVNAPGNVTRTLLPQSNEAIATGEIDFSHKFSPNTILTNKFYSEYGAINTFIQDQLQLAVKMTTKLALTVGYGINDNSNPPAPLKKIDTLTTVNLQYAF
jgi:putative salt-induced outer membrane protein